MGLARPQSIVKLFRCSSLGSRMVGPLGSTDFLIQNVEPKENTLISLKVNAGLQILFSKFPFNLFKKIKLALPNLMTRLPC